ncbi:MAG TPA: FtsX-like permease family protein, partial [Burkholderiales bacterium]|nr:FtsX-like permease family protein [Burkholderiales bacterium]
ETGRPEIRASVERARRFLALTALLAAVLAGVAIALGTRRFVERHLDGCAVMRCLGATQTRLLALHTGEFALLGLIACTAGALIGYAAQAGIGAALGGLINAELPPPTAWPALQGLLVGLVLLLGFALPPLLQLKNVPALRVIRRESGSLKRSALAAYGIGLGLLAALLVWQAGDAKLGAYVVGGLPPRWSSISWSRGARSRCSAACAPAAARCATALPTCAGTCAAMPCRWRASRSGSPPSCSSRLPATISSMPGGARRRPMRRTASSSACSPTSSRR